MSATNHVIKVTDRKISVEGSHVVANGIGSDTITLELDAQWDDLTAVVYVGDPCTALRVQWDGDPIAIPAQKMDHPGWLPVSVVGYDSTGAVRVTTEAEPKALLVRPSGVYDGRDPYPDQPDLLGQLVAAGNAASEAAKSANEAASRTEQAVSDAVTAADNANNAATSAKDAEEELRKAAEDGEFDGEKGDPGFSPKASVTQEPDGATISITDESGTTTAKVSNGADGSPGRDGESAEISGMTATVDGGSGTPSVDVEVGGTPTDRTFSLSFHNLKGDPGEVSAVQVAAGSDLSVSMDEGTVTIDDSALKERITELENQAANVVTGTSTGLVAHGEDAYAQKPIEVRVKGKTWVNRWPKFPETQTTNGVTLTCDETGLFTISGTASSFTRFAVTPQGIGQNKDVAILLSAPLGDGTVAVLFKGSSTAIVTTNGTASSTGNTGSFETITAAIQVTSGTTVNASFRVMLVDGTEAPDCFTPPASIASVETGKLVTSGKNLATETAFSLSPAQYSARIKTVSGELTPGAYFLKCVDATGVAGLKASLVDADGDTYKYLIGDPSDGIEVQVTRAGLLLNVYMDYDAGDAAAYEVRDLQLELGSTATSYEPPTVTETALPEVELRSLPNGTCDELVVKSDGTCEVERKVVEYEVTGAENISVGEHSSGQKYASLNNAISSVRNSSMLSAKYVCGAYNATVDKYAYIPTSKGIIINDSRFTDLNTARQILTDEKPIFLFEEASATTEPQSPVTLPALPAPTFNQYHDSAVPSDTSTQYARDINLVLANLEAVQTALLGGE